MGMPAEYFRAGVGGVIVNDQGLVLALERLDTPGVWQLPQGGLETGEEPLSAVLREVTEETGIPAKALTFVHQCPDPLVYELPLDFRSRRNGRGQVQYWFFFRFHGEDTLIDLTNGGEFRAWKWISFATLAPTVAEFRWPIYRRLVEEFLNHVEVNQATS